MAKLRPLIALIITLVVSGKYFTARAQNTVIINGINHTDQKCLFLEVDCWSKSFIGANNAVLGKENISSDSVFSITIPNIKEPTLCYIKGLNLGGNYNLYISPGDSLSVMIDKVDSTRNKIYFIGKNAAHYNYDVDLSDAISKYNFRSAKNLSEFKSIVDSIQTAANTVMNKYLSLPLAPEFKKIIKLENQVSYYSNIGTAYGYLSSFTDTVMPKRLVNAADVPFNLLTDSTLLYSRTYTIGLLNLVNLLNGEPGYKRSVKNMQLSYSNIDKYFSGKTKEYLLAELMSSYAHHAQSLVESDEFNNMWINCNNKIDDSYYKQWMLESKDYYFKVNKPFPLAALQSILKDSSGKKLTMDEILSSYKGKPVVLDFWATWCGACKLEFSAGNSAVDDLKNKGYEFVYISIDKKDSFDKVQVDAEKYKFKESNYILDSAPNSALNSFLEINSIPRYVLLDGNGNIKNLNMPNPSNKVVFNSMLPHFDPSHQINKDTVATVVSATKPTVISFSYIPAISPW